MKIMSIIIGNICQETEFLINLIILIVFLSAIPVGILCWWKTKQILYFWFLCQFAFFLVLANFVLFPRFECRYYNKYAPTEFFKIKEEEPDVPNNSIHEDFVLSNPPNDTLLLKKIVEEYNFRTIPVDKLKKYEYYKREFYRETKCLTRNYEEGKPYPRLQWWLKDFLTYNCNDEYSGDDPGQQIRYHYYDKKGDLLMITTHYYSPRNGGGFWTYNYRFGSMP